MIIHAHRNGRIVYSTHSLPQDAKIKDIIDIIKKDGRNITMSKQIKKCKDFDEEVQRRFVKMKGDILTEVSNKIRSI